MGLRGLVNGLTSTVNPNIVCQFYASSGYTTGYGGKRSPGFAAPIALAMQVQALSYGAMRHADSLNIAGVKRQIYLDGVASGIERNGGKGGDILYIPSGAAIGYWLVVDVLEQWDNDPWVKVLVVQQNGVPDGINP